MMIPIKMIVERVVNTEDDEQHSDIRLDSVGRPATYRIVGVALDTETMQTLEYHFHSMVDRAKPPYEDIGHMQVSSADLDYLEELRAKLDRILGDPGSA